MRPMTHLRRAALLLTVATALALAATPANAQPEFWSEPDSPTFMRVLTIFVLAPVGLAVLISVLALAPSMVAGKNAGTEDAPRD